MKSFFNSKELLGFDDKLFMLLGIPIVSMMINAILFGHMAQENPGILFSNCLLISATYTTFFWLTFRSIHQFTVRKFPGYSNLSMRYTVLIPTVIGSYVVVKSLMGIFLDPLLDARGRSVPEPEGPVEYIASFLFLVLIISLYEGAYLFVQLKKARVEKEQLIKENISSQLEGLKNQVNPHFLFNSLNTLASIIPEDADRGVRFVTQLAKVYRYILDINDSELIPLEEELTFIRSYTYLINERFGENISINIDVSDVDRHKMVIPLSLQITF